MDMRQLDPAIGRWVVQDPVVHHDYSPYSAFDNNPVYWSDPSGADSETYVTIADLFKKAEKGVTSFYFENGQLVGESFAKSIETSLQQTYLLLEAPTEGGGGGNGNGGGDGNGGGKNGNKKTYEYKGEHYSSSEMLYADLLIETILEEASFAYVYTVASVLDNSGLLQKGFQMKGASSSTSFGSKYLAPAIDKSLKKLNLVNKSKLPTHFRGNSLRSTTSTGRFITRWNGNIATAILIYQIADIVSKTNMKYIHVINGPYKYEKYKY